MSEFARFENLNFVMNQSQYPQFSEIHNNFNMFSLVFILRIAVIMQLIVKISKNRLKY